jgi:hypothetical protein
MRPILADALMTAERFAQELDDAVARWAETNSVDL